MQLRCLDWKGLKPEVDELYTRGAKKSLHLLKHLIACGGELYPFVNPYQYGKFADKTIDFVCVEILKQQGLVVTTGTWRHYDFCISVTEKVKRVGNLPMLINLEREVHNAW